MIPSEVLSGGITVPTLTFCISRYAVHSVGDAITSLLPVLSTVILRKKRHSPAKKVMYVDGCL